MKKTKNNSKLYLIKKFKTYGPEEIVEAGGSSKFARLKGYNFEDILGISGVHITEKEYQEALLSLTK